MSKGHGGKREGAGRPTGSGNLADIEQRRSIAELARSYSAEAIEVLVSVMRDSEGGATRVSAVQAILDRAYGKPVQANEISGPEGEPITNPSSDAIIAFLMQKGATEHEIRSFISSGGETAETGV